MGHLYFPVCLYRGTRGTRRLEKHCSVGVTRAAVEQYVNAVISYVSHGPML